MKRILLITESLGSGGAERQICGLAKMLTMKGYPCRLITYVNDQFYEPYLIDNKVDYEYNPRLRNKSKRVFFLVRYLWKYKPDVIISFLPSVNISCCLAKVFYPCRLIVSERNNNIGLSKRDLLQFNLYRLADFIVPNSYSQGEFIKSNIPFLKPKVLPIINFVDFDNFKLAKKKSKERKPRVITVARYTSQKNCLLFLEVVKQVKENGIVVHFDWFGSKHHDAEYYAKVEKKVAELQIEDYITLHSASKQILLEYQKSDIFCLPSIYEGYPNVVVEAMCCGLPVLCSRIFDNPYIIEENVNGYLFDPNSVPDIVSAISKVLSLSYNERIEMGLRNRNKCIDTNSEQRFVDAYINLIEQ